MMQKIIAVTMCTFNSNLLYYQCTMNHKTHDRGDQKKRHYIRVTSFVNALKILIIVRFCLSDVTGFRCPPTMGMPAT